jgi:hypothetical protein
MITDNSFSIRETQILQELRDTRASITELIAPSVSGVYAIFLKSDSEFPLADVSSDGLLYIGSSGNLAARKSDAHLNSANTGFSTLRRTLGAILKIQLKLEAMPRGRGKSKKDVTNYRFDPEGEKTLTGWLVRNLEIGVCTVDGDYEALEKSLIRKLKPVLSYPYPSSVEASKELCREEARRVRSQNVPR